LFISPGETGFGVLHVFFRCIKQFSGICISLHDIKPENARAFPQVYGIALSCGGQSLFYETAGV
jgi:hypothetical protein